MYPCFLVAFCFVHTDYPPRNHIQFTETSDRVYATLLANLEDSYTGTSPGIDDRRKSRTWSETKAVKPLILSSCRVVSDDLPSHMISSLDGNHSTKLGTLSSIESDQTKMRP
jgi:hypothetical protein